MQILHRSRARHRRPKL